MTSAVALSISELVWAVGRCHALLDCQGWPDWACLCVQNHQIDQLKEEISGKDLALVKEHFDHMKVSPATNVQP